MGIKRSHGLQLYGMQLCQAGYHGTAISAMPTTASTEPTATQTVMTSLRTNAAIGRTNSGSVEFKVLAMLTSVFSIATRDNQNPPNVTTKTETTNSAAKRRSSRLFRLLSI